MDIDGLGPAVVEALVNAGLVKTPGDLYFLKELSRVFLNVTGRNPGKTHE